MKGRKCLSGRLKVPSKTTKKNNLSQDWCFRSIFIRALKTRGMQTYLPCSETEGCSQQGAHLSGSEYRAHTKNARAQVKVTPQEGAYAPTSLRPWLQCQHKFAGAASSAHRLEIAPSSSPN